MIEIVLGEKYEPRRSTGCRNVHTSNVFIPFIASGVTVEAVLHRVLVIGEKARAKHESWRPRVALRVYSR